MSSTPHTSHSTGKYIIWLALLVLVGLGLYSVSFFASPSAPAADISVQERIEPPPFTPEIEAQLKASKGFALLVSYTDNGFEPQTAAIQSGETIRFTNNSSHDMWVAASTKEGSLYPSAGSCGQSAFDSCRAIGRGMFYEFTFEKKGTWGFHDNSEPVRTGKVVVE